MCQFVLHNDRNEINCLHQDHSSQNARAQNPLDCTNKSDYIREEETLRPTLAYLPLASESVRYYCRARNPSASALKELEIELKPSGLEEVV